MRYLLATVIFTLICCFAFAQKAPFKFGNIPIDDLKMIRYEKDTSAAAVVLGDYGELNIIEQAEAATQIQRAAEFIILAKTHM